MTVAKAQKFTANDPCPVCGGNPNSPRGKGERCYGFFSEDRKYANCTRDEFGGSLTKNASSNAYSHYLISECRCGKRHSDFNTPAYTPTSNAQRTNSTPRRSPPLGDPVAIYEYGSGADAFEVHRFEPVGEKKTFLQCRIVDGKRIWNLNGVTTSLYHQKNVESAGLSRTILIPEGEKDVHTLESRGLVATCNPMGAGKWRSHYNPTLTDRTVVIIEDNDNAGREHVEEVAANLYPVAESVKILRIPGLPKGGDVSDFLQAGGTTEQLKEMVDITPEWSPVVAGGWGAMEDIPSATLAVPTLPPELLPEPLREWLVETAKRAHFPLEYVAMPALSALGSVIGRQVGIRPEKFNDHTVVPNLWSAIIGRPGTKKTHAIKQGLRHLTRLEAEAVEAHAEAKTTRETEQLFLKTEIDNLQTEIKAALKGSDQTKIDRLKLDLADLFEQRDKADPPPKRYLTSDPTIEKLGELLNQNPRGLMVFRDELTGWLQSLDKPNRENDRPFYLEGWDGDSGHIVDRLGRGHLPIPAMTLTICGGIVPGKMRKYTDEAVGGGEGSDGLLQRFQLLVWPDDAAFPKWKPATSRESVDAKNEAWAVYKRLSEIEHPDNNPDDPTQIPAVHFTDEAQKEHTTWMTELEDRLHTALESTPAFESHMAKYRSLAPALALIIYLAELPAGEAIGDVPLKPLQMALNLCDLLELHAKKVFSRELNPGLANAFALSQRIEAGAVHDGDKVRDIYRKGWSELSSSRDVFAAVEILERLGWVRVDRGGSGGQATETLSLHPELRGESNG